jgi:hypothetical protein
VRSSAWEPTLSRSCTGSSASFRLKENTASARPGRCCTATTIGAWIGRGTFAAEISPVKLCFAPSGTFGRDVRSQIAAASRVMDVNWICSTLPM